MKHGCSKKGYSTKKQAWAALKAVKARRRTKRTEYIAYECPYCHLFHLTSKKGYKVYTRMNHG